MRRAAALLLLVAFALIYPVSSGAAPAPATHAAKLKKCKPGLNTKKCRCPTGQKLVKKGRKYRCKKKPTRQQQPGGNQGTPDTGNGTGTNTDPGTGTGTNTDPGTGTNTDPGTGTGTGTQTERDDAGYRAALAAASRFGPRTDESSNGSIFTYTYDFCANGQFSHHSEYYNSAFGQSEAYYNGTWQLEQGFKVLQSTNGAKWAGILVISENDGTQSRIELDLNDNAGQFIVGNSAHLTGGLFSRAASVC
jgi:hypothetical protein